MQLRLTLNSQFSFYWVLGPQICAHAQIGGKRCACMCVFMCRCVYMYTCIYVCVYVGVCVCIVFVCT